MKAALLSLCLAAGLALPATAADRDDTARQLQVMREEVAAMRGEIMSLNVKLSDMQTLLREMNGTILKMRNSALEAEAANGAANAQECETRLTALRTKMDKLQTLGYKPEHPDLRNISGTIKKLEAECGAGTQTAGTAPAGH